ncbi:hypothetical protein ACVWZ4_001234 [Bradyrhizobium sp. USDA 4472]
MSDAVLAAMVSRASKAPLDHQELEAVTKSIEAAISAMSESDKKLIGEGLHQDNPRGTKRYVRDLLTASA